jgi:CubicO group peptidase (beta-lactamase class C family)
VGLDPQLLDELAVAAEAARSTCLVVVRDGRIAGEWYFDGAEPTTTRPVWSVTKSITSTLVGIAQDDGALTVDESASNWVPAWSGTPAEQVTVRDLLANDSGREWSLALDYGQLLRSDDQTTFAVGLSQPDPPGQVWAYNNAAIQALDPVLRNAIDGDVATFAEERLFEPLGMDDTTMLRDPAGNTLTYAWATSTCRDLARFGQMMLAEGRWGDEQIVSPEWVDAATGAPSTDLNAGYGYLWWLNHEGVQGDAMGFTTAAQAADPATPRRQIVPGAPADVYWARGFGNQIVQVHPGTGTVLVRLSTETDQTRPPVFGVDESTRLITEGVTGPVPGS